MCCQLTGCILGYKGKKMSHQTHILMSLKISQIAFALATVCFENLGIHKNQELVRSVCLEILGDENKESMEVGKWEFTQLCHTAYAG